jgi:hypothetical protein
MLRLADQPVVEAVFRCGRAARWAPRVLAAAMIVAVLLVTRRFQDAPGIIGGMQVRWALWIGAAFVALWILNKGAELRVQVGLSAEGLDFSYGARPALLPFGRIETLRFDPPFSARRSWVAATVLLDERGEAWRLPVALESGDRLVADLVQRTGREDLATWADVLRIERRMRKGTLHTLAVYAAAAGILVAALVFYWR